MSDKTKKQFLELNGVPTISQDKLQSLKVLMLADNRHSANVVLDYINAFTKYSNHHIEVINPIHDSPLSCFQVLKFDIILIHYSIYTLDDYFLSEYWNVIVAEFPGLKVQIIQDEYRSINMMTKKMTKLGISVIISALDFQNIQQVYADDTPSVNQVISCLPGYISDYFYKISGPPIAKRPLDIVYRGRILPPSLGLHAYDKYSIGEQMIHIAKAYDLKVDISSEEGSRIYGDKWNCFISSGRTTLGVEGGASIFDFDGEVSRRVSEFMLENPKADFNKVWNLIARPYEGNIVNKNLTPKLLEAIASKTALILYPGKYNGILSPGRHYIELKRDLSNIDVVLEKIKDTSKLQKMVNLTHDEILNSERLTFRYFVRKIDEVFLHNKIWPNSIINRLFSQIFFLLKILTYQLKKYLKKKLNSKNILIKQKYS
ncbi:hypothetical protein N8143_03515 [Pelagibacteraceae bacterium]|nr:hypothetical protein [Pelagibacteraceae bacterium]